MEHICKNCINHSFLVWKNGKWLTKCTLASNKSVEKETTDTCNEWVQDLSSEEMRQLKKEVGIHDDNPYPDAKWEQKEDR